LIGSVSRLFDQKAPEVLLEAFARILEQHPSAHAVLVGDGPRQQPLAAAGADERMGSRFHHLAHVPEVGRTLGDLDVFVLASRFEGAPYAPLEAMLAGTAVVLTDVVGNRDIVRPGCTGELVPADDPAALAAAVGHLLSDAERRSALGRAATDDVLDRFTVRQMAARLEATYARVASAPRS
jgi:Glycosyltransferase